MGCTVRYPWSPPSGHIRRMNGANAGLGFMYPKWKATGASGVAVLGMGRRKTWSVSAMKT